MQQSLLSLVEKDFQKKKYLLELKKIAKKNNSVLIFEITSGWRVNPGGAHKLIKVDPDMVSLWKSSL